jgi:hypothetical protein
VTASTEAEKWLPALLNDEPLQLPAGTAEYSSH